MTSPRPAWGTRSRRRDFRGLIATATGIGVAVMRPCSTTTYASRAPPPRNGRSLGVRKPACSNSAASPWRRASRELAALRAATKPEISEVNVVPLADVSLVLLIILLVLSPMMRQSMLHVRTAADSLKPQPAMPKELFAPQPPELVLIVGLRPNGLFVGSQHFSKPTELADFLRAKLARRADKKVFLEPRPDVPVGLIVRALETIKTSGAESVALVQTQDGDDGQIRAAAPAP